MNLNELKTLLQNKIAESNNSLLLKTDLLPEAGSLVHYLKEDELDISNANINTSFADKVEVSGQTRFLNVDHNVVLTGKVKDSEIQLILNAVPTITGWSFVNSFPKDHDVFYRLPDYSCAQGIDLILKESFFYDLTFHTPSFTVANYEDSVEGVVEGLSFSASLFLTGPFEKIKTIIEVGSGSVISSTRITGTIDLHKENFPIFDFQTETFDNFSYNVGQLQMTQVRLRLETIMFPGIDVPVSRVLLEGKVPVGSSGYELTASVPLLRGDFLWDFRAYLSDKTLSIDSILQNLIETAGIDSSSFELPSPLDKFTSFYLSEVGIGIEPVNKTTEYLLIAFTSPEVWETPFPNFTISNLSTEWQFPLGNSVSLYGYVYGTLNIGERDSAISLDVSVRIPDFDISVKMQPDDEINITDLLAHFIGDGFEFEEELIIDRLEITAELRDKSFYLLTQIKNTWYIGSLFNLSPVNLIINYTPAGISAELYTQLNIKVTIEGEEQDISLYAKAAQAEPKGGWQFEGGTAYNKAIPIGALISSLANQFGAIDIPAPIAELSIRELRVGFNTKTKSFTFICQIKFPVTDDGKELDLTVDIACLRESDGSFSKTFKGRLLIAGFQFDLAFSKDRNSQSFTAVYHKEGGTSVALKDIIEAVSSDSDLIDLIPDGLSISLNEALFVYHKTAQTNSKFLFGLNVGAGLDLADLPLVGKKFPSGDTTKLLFQVLIASQNFTKEEVAEFSQLLPLVYITLPAGAINRGPGVSAALQTGGTRVEFILPIGFNRNAATAGVPASPVALTQEPIEQGEVQWITIGKSIGPLRLNKVGAQYLKEDSQIQFLLDASIALGGLSLSLAGLGVSTPLTEFRPTFHLRGLGISYKKGAVEISGAFLRDGDDYYGKAVIKLKKFSITAIGGYSTINGHPSLFIYAVLNMPIGGPPIFFITGLAAGFGYNRELKIPEIERVKHFPLVTAAMGEIAATTTGDSNTIGSNDPAATLTSAIHAMKLYIPPSHGQMFFAVGIKFTSFKLVESFAVLIVSFGRKFRIDVLGLSRLVLPPSIPGNNKTALVLIEMAFKVSFVPDEGLLEVRAQLTPASFVLSPACRLTGGFAFYSWFGNNPHAGDFVITLGGYHPRFRPPSHYPQVPRLGFNWPVTPQLRIKGDMYCAITPSAVMAGGHLDATWNSGSIKAWFRAGADFIISWKPYFYDIHVYISLGASVDLGLFDVTIELGADLQIWGPEFSGIAKISVYVCSFTIHFGAGADRSPPPLEWSEFRQSFLPAEDKICTINVQEGLIDTYEKDGDPVFVVNPKQARVLANSFIPAEEGSAGTYSYDNKNVSDFGIAPMKLDRSGVSSSQTIIITKQTSSGAQEDVTNDAFIFEPVLKNMPKALWGEEYKADIKQNKGTIDNLLSGFEILPKPKNNPAETEEKPVGNFAYDIEKNATQYAWENASEFAPDATLIGVESDKQTSRFSAIQSNMQTSTIVTDRKALFQDLGYEDSDITLYDLDTTLKKTFIVAPQVV